MEQNDENLVDKKIAEAKLEVVEKRFQITIWSVGILLTLLAALFGMIIPMISANRNSDKVDDALNKLDKTQKELLEKVDTKLQVVQNTLNQEKEFLSNNQKTVFGELKKETTERLDQNTNKLQSLIDQQIKIPKLVCLYNGSDLNGKTITVVNNINGYIGLDVGINNYGGLATDEAKIFLYQKKNAKINFRSDLWTEQKLCDEIEFEKSFEFTQTLPSLRIQYTQPISLEFFINENVKVVDEEFLIKIYYYEQGREPLKTRFWIHAQKTN